MAEGLNCHKRRGLVEKLFEKYGYIFGQDNQRYVFQFDCCIGGHDGLKVGDSVEYVLVTDNKTLNQMRVTNLTRVERPKPQLPFSASVPSHLSSQAPAGNQTASPASAAIIENAVYSGFVFIAPRPNMYGSIACQLPSGQSNFVSFGIEDLRDRQEFPLIVYGKKVHLQLKKSTITGSLQAFDIVPEAITHRGVVSSVIKSTGIAIIEKAEVKAEVYFENFATVANLHVNDCVEYITIPPLSPQIMGGREKALRLEVLPAGSVVIYDLSGEFSGTLIRLPGNAVCETIQAASAQTNSFIPKLSAAHQSLSEMDAAASVLSRLGINGSRPPYQKDRDVDGMILVSDDSKIAQPYCIPILAKNFTLKHSVRHGDVVSFRKRTDRRTKEVDAYAIVFCAERSFEENNEARVQGVIESVRSETQPSGVVVTSGTIRTVVRSKLVQFNGTELIDSGDLDELKNGAAVEFTLSKDKDDKGTTLAKKAKRILLLGAGSPKLAWRERKCNGVVSKLPLQPQLFGANEENNPKLHALGEIKPDTGLAITDKIYFKLQDLDMMSRDNKDLILALGDEVEFALPPKKKACGHARAIAVRIVQKATAKTPAAPPTLKPPNGVLHYGFIALVRDKFGFVELMDRSRSCYFSLNACNFPMADLKPRLPVKFELTESSDNLVRATNISKADEATFGLKTEVIAEMITGVVTEELKLSGGQNNTESGGLASAEQVDVQVVQGKINIPNVVSRMVATFTLTSLGDARLLPKKGAQVQCRLLKESIAGVSPTKPLSTIMRADNVLPTADVLEAEIDSIIDGQQYGFIAHQISAEKKNLFFHASEVVDGSFDDLNAGDTVQFYIWEQKKRSKHQAIHVRKIKSGSGLIPKKKLAPQPKPSATMTNGEAKNGDVVEKEELPPLVAPLVDSRPERLRMRLIPRNANVAEKGPGGTGAGGGEAPGGTGAAGEASGAAAQVLQEIKVVREPLFAPNLETKGFTTKRRPRVAGMFCAVESATDSEK